MKTLNLIIITFTFILIGSVESDTVKYSHINSNIPFNGLSGSSSGESFIQTINSDHILDYENLKFSPQSTLQFGNNLNSLVSNNNLIDDATFSAVNVKHLSKYSFTN